MELWRIFKFVSFVKKQTRKDPDYALESFLIDRYSNTRHILSRRGIGQSASEEACRQALERGYLTRNEAGGLHVLRITDRGRDLTEMIAIGFVIEAGKKYQVIISLVVAAATIIGVVVAIESKK